MLLFTRYPWLPYVAPMAAFVALTAVEGTLPVRSAGNDTAALIFAWFYVVKILFVAGVGVGCRSTWLDLRPRPVARTLAAAIAVGLLIAVLWVGLDAYYPRFGILGARQAFDPSSLAPSVRYAWLAMRFFGLILVVPLIEELFWRSFLMRWIIEPDFQKVPIGRVTPLAAAITAVLFAVEHPEWLPALITGLMWAGLLAWSRSVAACWISHAVANAALGAYVVATGAWKFL